MSTLAGDRQPGVRGLGSRSRSRSAPNGSSAYIASSAFRLRARGMRATLLVKKR